jgi:hypothetical protein
VRRRAFLDQDVIDASRRFVCVRLNAWLDELHVERVVKLQGFHQNSALALLAPNANGLAPDDFPTADDCAWGPFDFKSPDDENPWETIQARAGWMLGAMNRLAADHPPRPESSGGRPVVPVFPSLEQALNMAACDSRAVLVAVGADKLVRPLDTRLLAMMHDPAVAGRVHALRMTPEQWATALQDEHVLGEPRVEPSGVYVIAPDPYGQSGTVLARSPGLSPLEDVRRVVHEGLGVFSAEFRKKDRSSHIVEGRAQGVRWDEFDATGWTRFADEEDCEVPAVTAEEGM